jgi:tetratricopeptide (TPR) repeat protein
VSENDETSGSRRERRQAEQAAVAGDAPAPAGVDAVQQEENRRARRAAAARRRAQREKEPRPRPGLEAGERVDDAFSRAADGSFRWLREHFNIVQYLIVGAVALWIGWQIYSWRSEKTATRVGGLLADAVAADLGRIGEPDDQGKRDARGALDTRLVFKTPDDRFKAAADGYRKVAAERPGTPAAGLAKLGLAGVLYDQGKYDEARALYEEVSNSELAKLDPDAKGRSLEGIGLCVEAKGDQDGALKRFTALENAELPGFRDLALFHEARVLHAKGDDAGAKERLKKVVEKLAKDNPPNQPPSYLYASARDLLERIDPRAVPQDSNEALQKALQEFQKKLPPGVKRVNSLPAPAGP